jgi:hypothetical protein
MPTLVPMQRELRLPQVNVQVRLAGGRVQAFSWDQAALDGLDAVLRANVEEAVAALRQAVENWAAEAGEVRPELIVVLASRTPTPAQIASDHTYLAEASGGRIHLAYGLFRKAGDEDDSRLRSVLLTGAYHQLQTGAALAEVGPWLLARLAPGQRQSLMRIFADSRRSSLWPGGTGSRRFPAGRPWT